MDTRVKTATLFDLRSWSAGCLDRVERALAQYQAQQDKPATPMIKPKRNGPVGASFGRKRA